MKRITLALLLLVGGTSVASAEPPGLTPGPDGPYQQAPQEPGPGAWDGARGPRMHERGPGRMQRGDRMGGQRMGGQRMGGQRMGGQRHRLPPQLRARLLQMFDRNQDGRLEGPERVAARRFARTVIVRRHLARQGFGPHARRGR